MANGNSISMVCMAAKPVMCRTPVSYTHLDVYKRQDQARIIDRLQVLPLLNPARETHIQAAMLRNACRRNGVQIGTIDALIAQLCIEHDLALLTADNHFVNAARFVPLKLAT